jgi:hypothetical protein
MKVVSVGKKYAVVVVPAGTPVPDSYLSGWEPGYTPEIKINPDSYFIPALLDTTYKGKVHDTFKYIIISVNDLPQLENEFGPVSP